MDLSLDALRGDAAMSTVTLPPGSLRAWLGELLIQVGESAAKQQKL